VENTAQNLLEKSRLQLLWDTLNTLWLEYVINLDRQKQGKIFSRIGQVLSNVLSIKVILVLPFWGLLVALIILRRKVFYGLVNLYYRLKYGIKIPLTATPVELYLLLWERYPSIWLKERNRLLKLAKLLIRFKS
jgi:hypothetical protein